MDTEPINPIFSEFLKCLSARKVEFLIVGGYAVIAHGYVRSTGDLDVWIARNPENAARVVGALEDLGLAPHA